MKRALSLNARKKKKIDTTKKVMKMETPAVSTAATDNTSLSHESAPSLPVRGHEPSVARAYDPLASLSEVLDDTTRHELTQQLTSRSQSRAGRSAAKKKHDSRPPSVKVKKESDSGEFDVPNRARLKDQMAAGAQSRAAAPDASLSGGVVREPHTATSAAVAENRPFDALESLNDILDDATKQKLKRSATLRSQSRKSQREGMKSPHQRRQDISPRSKTADSNRSSNEGVKNTVSFFIWC